MRRYWPYAVLILAWCGAAQGARPIFENRTPVGFSVQDSTTQQDFVVGQAVSVRVDLNQAATLQYPVVGHFHALERNMQLSSTDTDGMQVDIAMVDEAPFGSNSNQAAPGDTTAALFPAIHMAWIEQNGTSQGTVYNGGITPVYRVMYTRSFDGGKTFSTAVSVSGNTTYHPLTVSGSGTSFSTLDLEVDSNGRPRLVYAFVSTADRRRNKNVYFTYSQDGGGTWQTPRIVNDARVGATESRTCAFPRMAVDDRDNIFISYVRGTSTGGGADDIMLAKVNRFTSPFTILPIGATGAAGTGGIRLTPDAKRHTGPDLAVGDGDALHLIYFNDTDNRIEHRRMATDTSWVDISSSGWNPTADGATVATFVDEATANAALEKDATYYFPSIVVDRQRLTDRVYAVYKFGDNTPVEGIYFNSYNDTGTKGTGITWGTSTSLWKTSAPALFADGNNQYNVELDWTITERVAAVVDDRLDSRGDLHIAFSAGYSSAAEHDIYYARYNGTSWTLPEKVADDDSDGTGTQDGIASTDVFLLAPALAQHPDSESIFLAFAGGTGEGFGVDKIINVNHHPYFKVLGQKSTWEDKSVPVGGYQYTLSYTPVNPQSLSAEVADNPIYVHVADPKNGAGLGARADSTDGFLAGDWETVGTTLADDDKFYEGLVNEDATSTNEWGDDDDKIGLLVKLNVLGSDSSTNLQVVTNSTASGAGTGKGARTVRVGSSPPVLVAAGRYFLLGADIDIVPSNTAPTVSISQPDGTNDTANTEYAIQYSAQDSDDDLGGNLKLALYAYPTRNLKSVQDIRIFATLIADENDVSSVNSAGTNDLTEGVSQSYTWDDPPAALKSSALFASILRVKSGTYYIYIVADDGKNKPVFAVSPGVLTLRHSPIVQQIDPIVADTVDTGERTGLKANPYDLDFRVVDHDSEARVQLFYAAVSGITSVSASGKWPKQRFVLGKSVSGTRGKAITDSASLSTHTTELSWDITSPLVAQGSYYLYAVASDSVSAIVGNSTLPLVIRHSPSFTFYEPARDTQRRLDSGSQPTYTIQWQKGPGDQDLDSDATIDLYFTTDDPAVVDHSTAAGASSTSLTGDADTKLIVSGLKENSDGSADMYVWNLRTPPNNMPKSGRQVWLYAVITDGTNTRVVRGGSLIIDHKPFVLLKTRMPQISQGDVVRLEWDDYMVDDGSGTDDAYIRLYASTSTSHTTLQALESSVKVGTSFIVNSSTGNTAGTITTIREDSSNAFTWRTRTSAFTLPEGQYSIYTGISADPTFNNNTTGRLSRSSNTLVVGVGAGTVPHLSLAPNKLRAAAGDTLTFEVLMQSGGQTATSISAVVDLGTAPFTVVNSTSPFTDLGEVFSGGTVVEDTTVSTKLRFTKNKTGGEIVGDSLNQKRLARFQVVVQSGFSQIRNLVFADETMMSISGSSTPLKKSTGLAVQNAQVEPVSRGRIQATVLLEGRSGSIGTGNHATLLNVHLRLPGSTIDISDSRFISANDKRLASADTVEVNTASSGAMTLTSVPAGRYVLTVKDSSHISGRTDTITVRNGETLVLGTETGFFASNVRGDASFLLEQDGRLLIGGDATGDNEVDEDDVNTIDAAWGTNTSKPNFARADINNDGRVGVEDLSLATSNIGNTTGFGAPPVYKRAAPGGNGLAGLEVVAPDYGGDWRFGEEVELVFVARDLGDLAGYGLELSYDPMEVVVIGPVRAGAVFADNPRGHFERVSAAEGYLRVAASRYGKEWSASGEGELLRLRVQLRGEGFPPSLRLEDGRLISSGYDFDALKWRSDPQLLALPREFSIKPNFPNPFNPETTIPFAVPALGMGRVPVSVEIFNALGQRVRTLVSGELVPGHHRVLWDGRNGVGQEAGSGVYFYRVQVGEMTRVGRMALVK